MSQLNQSLQRLHSVEGCFIYCTGRSLWLVLQALKVPTSPLHVIPLILAPLSVRDVRETLRTTIEPDSSRALKRDVRVAKAMRSYLCQQVVRVSGGTGRILQYLLRALQQEAHERPFARSEADVDAAIERARVRVASVLELRITWDGPADDAADVPRLLQEETVQRQLLRLFVRALLLDAPFATDLEISLGRDTKVSFADAAVVLGLSYAPFSAQLVSAGDSDSDSPDGDDREGHVAEAGKGSSQAPQPTRLKLVAGDWLCRSLAADPHIASDPGLLVTAQFLSTIRDFGGTMSGRPFELLCVDSICARSLLSPDRRLEELVSPLHCSALRDAIVPRLKVVPMPKVTRCSGRAETPLLEPSEKALLLLSRSRWTGRATMHPDDLPWFLTEWLCSGTIAVPASAKSGAQDWFLRLGNAVIGNANKAVGPDNGTQWRDLRIEVSKAPTLSPPFSFTLVLWSLNLAPELSGAIADAEARRFAGGEWRVQDARLVRRTGAPLESDVKFTVPELMELIIVNPRCTTGGGLAGLIGSRALRSLHSFASDKSSLDVSSLVEWMSVIEAPPL